MKHHIYPKVHKRYYKNKSKEGSKQAEVIPRDLQTAVISPWERWVARSWKSVRLHPIVTKLHLGVRTIIHLNIQEVCVK